MQLVDGGINRRGYTYIDDAIEAIVLILEDKSNNCNKEIFNIGKPDNELSIKEMAYMLKDMFEKNFKVNSDPDPVIKDVSAEEFYGAGCGHCLS